MHTPCWSNKGALGKAKNVIILIIWIKKKQVWNALLWCYFTISTRYGIVTRMPVFCDDNSKNHASITVRYFIRHVAFSDGIDLCFDFYEFILMSVLYKWFCIAIYVRCWCTFSNNYLLCIYSHVYGNKVMSVKNKSAFQLDSNSVRFSSAIQELLDDSWKVFVWVIVYVYNITI